MVQFAVGDEPLWVGRAGHRGPLWHSKVDDIGCLPETQRSELLAWLRTCGCEADPTSVVVLRREPGVFVVVVPPTVERYPCGDNTPSWLVEPPPSGAPVVEAVGGRVPRRRGQQERPQTAPRRTGS